MGIEPTSLAWKAKVIPIYDTRNSYSHVFPQFLFSCFSGGGGRIRTFEGRADRFTVCSLWPLGNLPGILGKTRLSKAGQTSNLILQRRAPESFSNQLVKTGAGKGTRTPDLLITNQLLYQLSYASSANKNPHCTLWLPKLQ